MNYGLPGHALVKDFEQLENGLFQRGHVTWYPFNTTFPCFKL